MAGIQGQPTPKPKDLKSQVPAPEEDPFADIPAAGAGQAGGNDPFADVPSVAASGGQQAQGTVDQAQEESWYDVSAEGLTRGALNALPTVGAGAGAILGSAGGPLGAIAGAAGGGVGGQSLKSSLERLIFGEVPESREKFYGELKEAATTEGAGAAVGLSLSKLPAASKQLLKTKYGAKAANAVSELAETPLNYVKSSIKEAKEALEEPFTKLLSTKVSGMNTEVAGNTAKELLKENINTKYGKFINAYDGLDNVAKSVPVADESRRTFTQKVRAWAVENHGGDNYKMIKKFADDIDAASTGKQIDDVVRQINDASSTAYRNGATGQSKMLAELRDKADDFLESETTKLAARIQGGKANEREMAFLQRMMQQRGIAEPNASKYAKSLAKDYLNEKEMIKKDYRAFREFLSDVGEQTKIKAERKGPKAFLSALDDIPAEKLIERMFDPKNAAALRRMQQETPEVFDTVVKSKMNEIVKQANLDGKLDYAALRKTLNKMPESTRSMLISDAELKILDKVTDNASLKRLEELERLGENFATNWASKMYEATKIVGKQAAKGSARLVTPQTPMGQQFVGRTLAGPFIDAYQPAKRQKGQP
jgi:hypothetical protein